MMSTLAARYINPLAVDGDYADPFIMRFNGRYYLYCTAPDVRCWTSTDLLTWSEDGATIAPDVFPDLVPFAPEVFYADGWFYMVTSPHGRGHYILRSDSPRGPFVRITDNIGRAIDGNVLIDDDGRWYFYWAGWEGIWACEMLSPTQFGEAVLTGAQMNGWTEGPFVAKHEGRYYMTLTGNHFLSPGYRVNVAVSDHPLHGFVDDALNPVLLSTQGHAVGIGHSSSVRGPDLVSTYLAYHSIRPDQRRDLNLDRQVWSGRSLSVLGPSRRAVAPASPDVEGVWPEASSDWVTTDTSLDLAGEWATMSEGTATWSPVFGAGPFTLEITLKPDSAARTDILFVGEDGGEEAVLTLTADGPALAVYGTPSVVPPSFVRAVPHLVRIVGDGARLSIFVDGRLQMADVSLRPVNRRLAVRAVGGATVLGHAGLTRSTSSAADRRAVKPVPGRFWATLADSDLPRRSARANGLAEALELRSGGVARYDVIAPDAGEFRLFAVGEFPSDADLQVVVGGRISPMTRTSESVMVATVMLSGEVDTVEIFCATADGILELVEIGEPAASTFTVESVRVPINSKRLLVESVPDAVDIVASVWVDRAAAHGHADILFRASNLALGYEGDDETLGRDFFQGYSVQLHADRVLLARHDYDTTVVAVSLVPVDLGGFPVVRVRMSGGHFRVEVGGVPRLSWRDPRPLLVGGVGVRAVDARAQLSFMEIVPI